MCTTCEINILFTRRFAADAVFRIAIHLRKQKRFKNLEWLMVIPLFDFLKEYSLPFAQPEMNPQEIHWKGNREKELQLYEWQGKANPGYV